MGLKVAINGFGRIGRAVLKSAVQNQAFEVVAINDLSDPSVQAHLLKYDSIQGASELDVKAGEGQLMIGSDTIRVFAERDPANLPWKDLGIDVVIECTGLFLSRELAQKHLDAGARKVVLSAPAKGEVDKTIVLGVNDDQITADDKIISNASCTTNCLAPMVKVLHDNFGVKRGLMTTIHAYTSDQRLLDNSHKDLRRARAGAVNMIPTTTGAAKALGLVMPEMQGRLNGYAVRVPIPVGSLTDLTAELEKNVSLEAVNQAFAEAASGPMKGVLEYSEMPLVSADIVGNPHSSIIDGLSTLVLENQMVKTVSWYDNEWGYSCRVVDLVKKVGNL